jgi:RNA polymerase sigma-70 factor (ECF subfamily)
MSAISTVEPTLDTETLDTEMVFGPEERGFVYAIARRFVQNDQDAHDIAQEAMLLAFRHRDSFRGQSKYRTWLYRIATTTALSHLRRERRQRVRLVSADHEEALAAAMVSDSPRADDALADREAASRLAAQVRKLDPKYRQVLALRCEDRSEAEIATELGLSVATVKIRAHRARRQLKDQLGDLARG